MIHRVSEISVLLDFENNEKAGIEMKMILQPSYNYDEDYGSVIGDTTIVAYDPSGEWFYEEILNKLAI